MSTMMVEKSIGQLVAERPSRSVIFEKWGVDYCCGGKRSLQEACTAQKIDYNTLELEIAEADARVDGNEQDWTTVSLTELVDHIVSTHHAYLREALPRITMLTEKVAKAHGQRHPELAEVVLVFNGFRIGMQHHARKEENVLFPYVKSLESAGTEVSPLCGGISNPISVLESEHEEAGAALEQLRVLTAGYAVPDGACGTYIAMLSALEELEMDTHRHVHKENSILFPRAAQREAELTASTGTC